MSKNKYTILKWCHYSDFIPSFHKIKGNFQLSGTYMFDESCRYKINEPSCVNKLFGFCFGFGVHKNSARFGWTYDEETDSIKLWKYVYEDGRLNKSCCGETKIGEPIHLHLYVEQISPVHFMKQNGDNVIERTGTNYCVNFILNNTLTCYWYIPSESKFYTTLGPYFGGKTMAPHKITIKKI